MKCLRELFNGADGTWDLSRLSMALLVLAYVTQSAFAIWRGQPFNWQDFGIGAGSLMAGTGAGVWMHGKGP